MAQQPPQTTGYENARFVIFVHTGPRAPDDIAVKQIAAALSRKGYLVRAPDKQQDIVGGPGVDYFDDSALKTAQDVADTVNEQLQKLDPPVDEKKKLKPRPQRATKNPPSYLGVWLF
ncbi:MAG TPA: hypothetical protein VF601_00255 [Beijerinckiaceae bacterium]